MGMRAFNKGTLDRKNMFDVVEFNAFKDTLRSEHPNIDEELEWTLKEAKGRYLKYWADRDMNPGFRINDIKYARGVMPLIHNLVANKGGYTRAIPQFAKIILSCLPMVYFNSKTVWGRNMRQYIVRVLLGEIVNIEGENYH